MLDRRNRGRKREREREREWEIVGRGMKILLRRENSLKHLYTKSNKTRMHPCIENFLSPFFYLFSFSLLFLSFSLRKKEFFLGINRTKRKNSKTCILDIDANFNVGEGILSSEEEMRLRSKEDARKRTEKYERERENETRKDGGEKKVFLKIPWSTLLRNIVFHSPPFSLYLSLLFLDTNVNRLFPFLNEFFHHDDQELILIRKEGEKKERKERGREDEKKRKK